MIKVNKCNNQVIIKNNFNIAKTPKSFFVGFVDSSNNTYRITELSNDVFVMFECKRVGKEGDSKGPQTIEKAKQGAYVAKTVSSLQKVYSPKGDRMGIYFIAENNPVIGNYDALLNECILKKINIENFVLTVGVVSNHGNWFTENNKNKELEVLCNAYDWLLFLTDEGLAEFIDDIFKNVECKNAFCYSYTNNDKGKKNSNLFTKSCLTIGADKFLTEYFHVNRKKIFKWFNILNQTDVTIENLSKQLKELMKQ